MQQYASSHKFKMLFGVILILLYGLGLFIISPEYAEPYTVFSLLPVIYITWNAGLWQALILHFLLIAANVWTKNTLQAPFSFTISNMDIAIAIFGLILIACIHHFKKLSNKLKRTEQHLTTVFNKQQTIYKNIPTVAAVLNKEGMIQDVSSNITSQFGWSNVEIQGASLKRYIHKKHIEKYINALHYIELDKSQKKHLELKLKCKNGKYRWVSLSLQNKLDDTNIQGILTSFYDISTQHKAIKKLEENELKYRSLFDSSIDCVTLLDKNGVIVDINKSGQKLFGYSPEEFKGMHVSQIVHPDDMERSKAFFKKLDAEGFYKFYEGRVLKKNGEARWVQVNSKQFFKNGILQGSIDVVRDITEQRESEENLKELNKTKNKLFSVISHDLKSPFASIIGLSNLLISNADNQTTASIQPIANMIHQTAEKGNTLLSNLLQWSKSQTGKLKFNPEKINTYQLVKQELDFLEFSAQKKRIGLACNVPDNEYLTGDINMLKTVIRNLLNNAIKFTPKNGMVSISSEQNNTETIFTIKDTGVGMIPEEMEQLFSIKLSKTKAGTENESGSGLGLLICQEFVQKHGGNIEVRSELNAGSTFSFNIPFKS